MGRQRGALRGSFGGFVGGIVLHQILQWHNLFSNRLPPDNLVAARVNMYWDGVFHAAVWVLAALGRRLLRSATGRAGVLRSGRTLGGVLLLGWGAFNVLEGLIIHQLLALPHVRGDVADKWPWDLGFLLFGGLLLLGGWALVRRQPVRDRR